MWGRWGIGGIGVIGRGGIKKGGRGLKATLPGAINGARTRDPQLGKLMLYQLSYYRMEVRTLCERTAKLANFLILCKIFC